MSYVSHADWWRREATIEHPSLAGDPIDEPAGGSVSFWALVGFTVVLIVAPQQFFPVLGRLRIAFVLAIVAIGAQLFEGARSRSTKHQPVELRLVLGLVALAILSIPGSYWPTGSVNTLTDQYFKSVAIFWLLGVVVCSVQRLRALLWTLALASTPLALVGVHNYLSGAFIGDRVVGYDSGLASNPNDLALTLNLFIPLTVMLAATARRAWLCAVAWGMAGLSAITVLITFSRGGFLTLVTEGVFLALLLVRLRSTRALWTLALLALLSLAVLPTGYGQRLSTILNIQSDPTGSAQGRWRDIVAAARFISSHPVVGAGIGQGILAMNEVRGYLWLQVHNAYLNYALDLGIPGLLLFVALIATSYRSARRIERLIFVNGQPELIAFAGGIRISLIGFMVSAFFYPVPYHFYFYYIAGLAVALKGTGERQFALA